MVEKVRAKENILKNLSEEDTIELAKNLIRIPSPVESETEASKFLEKYMEDGDLETEMIEVEPGRLQPVGRIKGTGGGYSLMFNGHVDTDVIWMGVKDPFIPKIEGNRLYGHGIFNMKNGVAAMVEAAVAIKKSGIRLKGDLVVTPVVGELQGGVGTVVNIKKGIRTDFGLVPEPYGEFFCLAHAGVEEMAITIKGRSEHISAKEKGINLAAKMAKVMDALNNIKFTYTPDPRFPGLPRMIIGSAILGHGETHELKGACFLPDLCTIICDARYFYGTVPHKDVEKVLEQIKAEDPEFDYEMQIPPDDPTLPGIPWKNQRINMLPHEVSPAELIVKVHAHNYKYLTGKDAQMGAIPIDDPRHSISYAGDDDTHLTKAGIPSFVCGPSGGFGATGLQYTDIDSMVRVARNFALTAYDICTTAKV